LSQKPYPKRVKKTQETTNPIQNFKLLISVPATKTNHSPYQPQVLEAIKQAGEGFIYTLDVGETNEKGWQYVVDNLNKIAERVINENYDYVLIVESDVVIPKNALSHMLTVDADAVVAVVPWHNYPENSDMQNLYKELVCVAWFVDYTHPLDPESLHFETLHLGDVKDKVLTFKDGPLEAGTGCILIKRKVFESGIRFVCNFAYASFDVWFWRDLHRKGLAGACDGYVVCAHLDDVSFKDGFENSKGEVKF
jgi:hypothetical protein